MRAVLPALGRLARHSASSSACVGGRSSSAASSLRGARRLRTAAAAAQLPLAQPDAADGVPSKQLRPAPSAPGVAAAPEPLPQQQQEQQPEHKRRRQHPQPVFASAPPFPSSSSSSSSSSSHTAIVAPKRPATRQRSSSRAGPSAPPIAFSARLSNPDSLLARLLAAQRDNPNIGAPALYEHYRRLLDSAASSSAAPCRPSAASYCFLLKFVARRGDAALLASIGAEAAAWEQARPTPSTHLALLASNLTRALEARTGVRRDAALATQRQRRIRGETHAAAPSDAFSYAALLRVRAPALLVPQPHELELDEHARPLERSGRRPARPRFSPVERAPARLAPHVLRGLQEVRAEAAAEARQAELRREHGLLQPPPERRLRGGRDLPNAAEAKAFERWLAILQRREEQRLALGADMARSSGSAAELAKSRSEGKDSLDTNSLPAAYVVLAALRRLAEVGDAPACLALVRAYISAVPDEQQRVLMDNKRISRPVSEPDVPPRGASLLNLVLRAHLVAGQGLPHAANAWQELVGSKPPWAPRPEVKPAAAPAAEPSRTAGPRLVPDENTALLLLALLRTDAQRCASGAQLLIALMGKHGARPRAGPSARRSLRYTTRVTRVLLRAALRRGAQTVARKALTLHASWRRAALAVDGAPQQWERRQAASRGEKRKWRDVLNALVARRWISRTHRAAIQ